VLHDSCPLSYDALSVEELAFIEHLEKNFVLKDLPPATHVEVTSKTSSGGSPTVIVDSDISVNTSISSDSIEGLSLPTTHLDGGITPKPSSSQPGGDSPEIATYRDMLLAHLSIYSDKASPKEGVNLIRSYHRKNVTIRRKKGKGRAISASVDSGEPIQSPEYLPLYARIDLISATVETGALRESPPSRGSR